jgi:hypothetical protein
MLLSSCVPLVPVSQAHMSGKLSKVLEERQKARKVTAYTVTAEDTLVDNFSYWLMPCTT